MAIHFTPEVYRDYYENISGLNFLINEFSFNEYKKIVEVFDTIQGLKLVRKKYCDLYFCIFK